MKRGIQTAQKADFELLIQLTQTGPEAEARRSLSEAVKTCQELKSYSPCSLPATATTRLIASSSFNANPPCLAIRS